MKLDSVKLSLYKYKIKSLVFTYGTGKKLKKHTAEESLVLNMSIIQDYESEVLPFFTMTLAIPNNVYRVITSPSYKNTVTAKLNLQKGKFSQALSVDTSQTISFRDAIKGSFHVVIGAQNPDLTEAEQKLVEKSENKYGQLSTITVSLYNKAYYNTYQTIVNTNMKNVTLTDAIVYILKKAKIKNVLLSPGNNNKKYDEFRILPLQACEMLARICNTYAYHNKGSIIFFDVDRGYIIDKVPKCTAYVTNEFKITYLVASSESQGARMVGGAYENSQKKYNVINVVEMGADNTSDITKKTVGENTVSVSASGSITKTNKKATTVTNVVVQNEGKNTAQDIKRVSQESKKDIKCQMQQIDITMLKPNKQFLVSVNSAAYKKYNGKYRLVSAAHAFTRDGNYFTLDTVAQFKGQ